MNRWLTIAFGLATSEATGNVFLQSSPLLTIPNETETNDGLDLVKVGLKYVEKCSGIVLDRDDCLTSTVIEMVSSTAGASRRRIEQGGCDPPDYGSEILGLFTYARQQCTSTVYSAEQYEAKVNEILSFFGAKSCWVSLCDGSVEETFWTILYGEIAVCADVEINIVNPCLWERTISVIVSENVGEEFDDDYSPVENVGRRVLQAVSGNSASDTCYSEVPEAEVASVLSPWLAEAGQRCKHMGQEFGQADIDVAYAAFTKLLSAPPKCLDQEQVSNECDDIPLIVDRKSQEEIDLSFADFVRLDVFETMLGCVAMQGRTCVISKSVELLMGSMQSCTTPVMDEPGMNRITNKALLECTDDFAHTTENDQQDAVDSLMQIVSLPGCWEDVCSDQHDILDDWMTTCSLNDLGFVYSDLEYTESIVDEQYEIPLDTETLKCMIDHILVQKGEDADVSRECSMIRLGPHVCGADSSIGMAAYAYCSGEYPTSAPSPDSTSMSYSLDMFYSYDDDADAYISEVCHLLESIQYNPVVKACMQPMCEIKIDDVLARSYVGMPPSASPTLNPTLDPSASPTTNSPTWHPTLLESSTSTPTQAEADFVSSPTSQPTALPTVTELPTVKHATSKPSSKPTATPTEGPTNSQFGFVDVTFDVAVKLTGIKSLDFTTLGSVLKLLERVFLSMLPENSTIRMLKFAGVSVARRVLQSLEKSDDGVQVEFQVIITKQCDDAACTTFRDISNAAYDYVIAILKRKVEDGSLSKAIQEEADAEGLSELAHALVEPDSLKANTATVTVRTVSTDTDDNENFELGYDDDDSASPAYDTALSFILVSTSVLMFRM